MKKSTIPILLIIILIACSKETPSIQNDYSSLTPSQVVVKVFDALNRHDSATYASLISSGRKGDSSEFPKRLKAMFAFWSENNTQAHVQVTSERIDGSIAYVTYRITASGQHPVDTTRDVQLYRENDGWKFGW